MNLTFDLQPSKSLLHLFNTIRSFLWGFIDIDELKLELWSGNGFSQLGQIEFWPLWPWPLTHNLETTHITSCYHGEQYNNILLESDNGNIVEKVWRMDRRTSIFSQVRTEWKPAADPKENQTHIEYKYDRTTLLKKYINFEFLKFCGIVSSVTDTGFSMM